MCTAVNEAWSKCDADTIPLYSDMVYQEATGQIVTHESADTEYLVYETSYEQ